MYSTVNNRRNRLAVWTVIALIGVLTPVGAIAATPVPHTSPQVLQASQLHPQLAIPGDLIDVTLRTGKTQVVLVGPATPQIIAAAVPGTFTFSFVQKSGLTLIDVRDFGILDGNDSLIRPVRFDDGTTAFTLKAGQRRTVKITTFMASGTGTLRWAPLNHYVADWQFVQETD